ncbi:flagellar basal body-associated protein FliL [Mesorhizobium sp. M7A.F.Ca.CA.001.09.2.1]|uniref:Flagellar protein FliL n=3 Tax=Mesorhizobium TaxID=68287 RepID=E8TFW0_MESCW|nr:MULTISPECIES: flagellar basal body-associated FliL family protein [Mesorhizobium]RUY56608.1 flagellar basal body-associated protein FliL [Mesorhizobium sp. M7A.F.Ca.CA.001.13.2.1]RUZ90458.1 flagellar basal body-associated protein FliL [Mesorhizobium sp. M7A.F.Ca.US.003.02.2.1]RVA54261.1 flagellar basal body-associated protein FliL [Mesorhizobium sp. M7A.F.Ca.US.001.01.1.1]ADV11102.1 flagellar basal body-associated protein FliL [Mesorhizobium ciceri biovar biserrulae WSM1271]AMX94636.1 flage
MANIEQVQPRKGPSPVIQAGMLLLVTAAAIGVGWMSGGYLKGVGAPASVPVAPENEGKIMQPAAAEQPGLGPMLVVLAPITTNIASPAGTWIRMEVSVVYDAPQPQAMSDDIHQDLLALVRTLKMHQIEGASGYQHLKADLEERAAIRSQGHAKQVLIRTLLLE